LSKPQSIISIVQSIEYFWLRRKSSKFRFWKQFTKFLSEICFSKFDLFSFRTFSKVCL